MKDDLNWKGRDWDRELNSPEQMRVREIVQALPEETLSLSWRSELNTRLRAEAARRRRLSLFGWIWKPAAGVAVAGALIASVFFRLPGSTSLSPTPVGGIERALVKSYVESSAGREVAMDGLSPNETKDMPVTRSLGTDWDQEDVEATL